MIINNMVTIFHSALLKYKPLFIKCVKLIESVEVQYVFYDKHDNATR